MVSDAFPERNSQFKIHVIGQDLDYFFPQNVSPYVEIY